MRKLYFFRDLWRFTFGYYRKQLIWGIKSAESHIIFDLGPFQIVYWR